MDKKIIISGKRNIDGINNNTKRGDAIKSNIDFNNITHNFQIQMINSLYIDNKCKHDSYLNDQLKKKLRGYKNQDTKNNIYDSTFFISFEQTVEKLVSSKLHCFLCKDPLLLIYDNINDRKQWTLDRIDNQEGHNYNNVNIVCLDCNVKRKDMDVERFRNGKQFKFKKVNS